MGASPLSWRGGGAHGRAAGGHRGADIGGPPRGRARPPRCDGEQPAAVDEAEAVVVARDDPVLRSPSRSRRRRCAPARASPADRARRAAGSSCACRCSRRAGSSMRKSSTAALPSKAMSGPRRPRRRPRARRTSPTLVVEPDRVARDLVADLLDRDEPLERIHRSRSAAEVGRLSSAAHGPALPAAELDLREPLGEDDVAALDAACEIGAPALHLARELVHGEVLERLWRAVDLVQVEAPRVDEAGALDVLLGVLLVPAVILVPPRSSPAAC